MQQSARSPMLHLRHAVQLHREAEVAEAAITAYERFLDTQDENSFFGTGINLGLYSTQDAPEQMVRALTANIVNNRRGELIAEAWSDERLQELHRALIDEQSSVFDAQRDNRAVATAMDEVHRWAGWLTNVAEDTAIDIATAGLIKGLSATHRLGKAGAKMARRLADVSDAAGGGARRTGSRSIARAKGGPRGRFRRGESGLPEEGSWWRYADIEDAGQTDLWTGRARIARGMSAKETGRTIRHEWVHHALTPTWAPKAVRGRAIAFRAGQYRKGGLWTYAEEAAAETVGTFNPLRGLAYPVKAGGYLKGGAIARDLLYLGGTTGAGYAGYKLLE